ncbi:hypothetical protein [Nannocystis pusilla]|uniref:hypothetical protein n=1 Tax=Nannocystis pusilla TaxID=889268 RepID=UPI003DA4D35F
MPQRSLLWRLAPCLLAVLLVGCIRSQITEIEQQSFGTRTFAAGYEATFAAALEALPALGYQLQFVSAAQGRITTTRRQAGATAGIGLAGAFAAPLFRQYDLRLVRLDPGHTRVIAHPHVYEGERDRSHEAVWKMSGRDGEYEHWRPCSPRSSAAACARAASSPRPSCSRWAPAPSPPATTRPSPPPAKP